MKVFSTLPQVLLVTLFVFLNNESFARSLESDLTYPLMEKYCNSVASLATYTLKLMHQDLNDEEVTEKAVAFMEERDSWNGRLAGNIELQTVVEVMNGGKNGDYSVVKNWAYRNCNKKILFNNK